MTAPLRVTVWNEFRHERTNPAVAAVYPDGIHAAHAAGPLRAAGHRRCARRRWTSRSTACRGDVLDGTDVLLWWGHKAHGEVAGRGRRPGRSRGCWTGMGLIVLHSGHFSKIFKRLMGTSCDLKWREAGERERLWVVAPATRSRQGLPRAHRARRRRRCTASVSTSRAPESWCSSAGSRAARCSAAAAAYQRGAGRIFYFRPGHETYPTYHQPQIQRRDRATPSRWAAPVESACAAARERTADESIP